MTKDFTARIFNWQYTAKIVNEDLEISIVPAHNKPVPKELSKYYALTPYSVDALTNNYVYASHPFQLSDPFDSFQRLINYDNLTQEDCTSFLCPPYEKKEILKLYVENRKYLLYIVSESYWRILFSKIGIVSLTNSPLDIKMWTYYTYHTGFQVVFDVDKIPEKFKGPFPINYRNKFVSLDFNKLSPVLSMIYQTNIKSSEWKNEREWRYIVFHPNMYAPGIDVQKDPHDRKFSYSKKAIKEIILGFRFFDTNEIVNGSESKKFKLDKKSSNYEIKTKLIDYIITNKKIKTSLIYIKTNEFKLLRRQIEVRRIEDDIYELIE